MQRIMKAKNQESMRLSEMSRRRERKMARMKTKWQSNEEEGGTSQLPIVEELLSEIISNMVEEAEGKQGGCYVTRTEPGHKSNEKRVRSASLRPQVPLHICNLIKYLVYFQFVRYMKIEISHIIHIHEIYYGYFKCKIISLRSQIV